MKKILCGLICLLFVFVMVGQSVSAAELDIYSAAEAGADVFKAWFLLNNTNFDFFLNEYKSPYTVAYDAKRKSFGWQSMLIMWRMATFDLKSELAYAEKEIGYYEAFIYNMLLDEETNKLGWDPISLTSDFFSGYNDMYAEMSSSNLTSLLCKLNKLDSSLMKNYKEQIKGISEERMAQIDDCLKSCEELDDIFKIIESVNTVNQYCDDISDLLEKMVQAATLLKATKEAAEIISVMAMNCGYDIPMKTALMNISSMLTTCDTEELIITHVFGEKAIEVVSEAITKEVWKMISSTLGSYGIAISIGQSAGKFLTSTMFGTDDMINAYYQMEAMYKFENLIRAVAKNAASAFRSSPSIANARRLNQAAKMLMNTYIKGIEVTKDQLSAGDESLYGAVLKTYREYKNDTSFKQLIAKQDELENSIKFVSANCWIMAENTYKDIISETEPEIAALSMTPKYDVDESAVIANFDTIKTDSMSLSSPELSKDMTMNEDIEIVGSLTVNSGTLDLNGHSVTVYGDVIINGGVVDLNGGILTVGGDVLHKDGTMYIHCGTLNVSGDYAQAGSFTKNADGSRTYTEGRGYLRMENDSDVMRIDGSYGIYTYRVRSVITAGTMYIGGNFYQNNDPDLYQYGNNFSATGTHTVVFDGTGVQHIYFGAYYNAYGSGFNSVVFENKHIQLDSGVREFQIPDDLNLTIGTNVFGVDGTLDLNGCVENWNVTDLKLTNGTIKLSGSTLSVSGKLTLNGGSIDLDGCDLSLTSIEAVSGTLDMDESNVSVSENVTINGGVVDLNGGTLTVGGDVLHKDGTMYIHCGTLNISGDYAQAGSFTKNADGSRTYTTGDGYLRMENDSDEIRIDGSYGVYTIRAENTLSAGTIYIGGDFYQNYTPSNRNEDNFSASGTHTVVLNGSSKQTVHFSSYSSSTFNILRLTQPRSNYVFEPDPCWKTLYEAESDVKVTSITLDKSKLSLNVGVSAQLTASVLPENATDRGVKWISSDESVLSVSANGKVTALSAGTASVTAVANDGSGVRSECKVIVFGEVSEDAPLVSVTSAAGVIGGTAEVTISIENNGGISGTTLNVNYAPELRLVKAERGDALAALTFGGFSAPYQNPLTLVWYGEDNDTSVGTLVKLTFEIPEGTSVGDYPVTIEYIPGEVYDKDFRSVTIGIENGTVRVQSVIYGDVNGDGKINGMDITMIRRHLAGTKPDGFDSEAADVNHDGSVNGMDITLIRRYLTGGYGVLLN